MKKLLAVLLALTLVLSMAACASNTTTTETKTDAPAETTEAAPAEETKTEEAAPAEEAKEEEAPAAEPVDLIVFAAASMTETLSEIGNNFMAANPNVTIQFNFDSSGTLKTQIQESADCDVFISTGQKQMNQIDKDADLDANTEGLDFVLEGTRFNILENKVTLVVPEGNPKNINTFDDLATGLKEAPSFSPWETPTFPSARHPEEPEVLRARRRGSGQRRLHHLRLQRQGSYHAGLRRRR